MGPAVFTSFRVCSSPGAMPGPRALGGSPWHFPVPAGRGGSPHQLSLHFQQQQPFLLPRLIRDTSAGSSQTFHGVRLSGSRQGLICNWSQPNLSLLGKSKVIIGISSPRPLSDTDVSNKRANKSPPIAFAAYRRGALWCHTGSACLPINPPGKWKYSRKNGQLNSPCLQEGIEWITSLLIQQCLKSDSTDIEYLFYCGDTGPVQMHSVSTKSLFTEGRTEHFMWTHSGHDKELCLPLVI